MPRLVWQTTAPCPEVTAWVAHYGFGGIILFGDNVYSIAQVQAMSAALQAASPYLPLFIAIDEEGGRVSRVGRLFDWQIPAAYSILATIKCDCFGADNCEHRCVNFHAQANREAARLAHETGQRLTTLGINMNFAPVADVWTNPANTVIGNRAFSRDPYAAAEMVATTIYGLQRENIFAVAKHFPGHGDTYEDSHFNLAFYPHDRARFDTVEAIPFIRAIEAGVDGIMVGHISTPQLRGSAPILCWKQDAFENGWLPATFSDFWLQDVLRGEMGFEGLIVTDALDMRALTDHFTPEQIAVGAFLAGADILLMPTHPDRAFYALLDAFREGLITLERLEASVRRVLYAKADILP
ncbi:MAG: glycoside hydrolase family 3 protein [Defluviitaleaceae bacterium]|nr:glycoside hydrolase family 3 protein [Defluviitaleaceae bacterium]MCL2275987.1 glycoside hydrolase family 3 protein [Defluviitaleaceae bacterium]